jgi:putative two-component system response regulator
VRILIVDDDVDNLALLDQILSHEGYDIVRCEDGVAAVKAVKEWKIDLVLSDVMMPLMNGFEVTRQVKAITKVPVILLTGLVDKYALVTGLENGADEFLSKPFQREELLLRVRNILALKTYQDTLKDMVNKRTEKLKDALHTVAESNRDIVFRLLTASEYRDDQTGRHIIRVGKISRMIARNLGSGRRFIDEIEVTAPMHDLGKIGIPDQILLKPGKLTMPEFEIIKTHTTIGARILEKSPFRLIKMAQDIAHMHHERWDGNGYPGGIKESDIPLAARIVALSDVLDAILSKRPYKEAFSWENAMAALKEEKGAHFDPDIVNALFRTIDEAKVIYEQNHV